MARKSVADTPANPVAKAATVELMGEDYSLVYDFNAIAEAEAVAGANLFNGFMHILQGMTAAEMRGLLYAALRRHHPKMTIQQVGNLINLKTIPVIREALIQAYAAAVPQEPEPNENAAPADD